MAALGGHQKDFYILGMDSCSKCKGVLQEVCVCSGLSPAALAKVGFVDVCVYLTVCIGVCLSICVCVYISVYMSVWAYVFCLCECECMSVCICVFL